MGKYDALTRHLHGCRAGRLAVDFTTIEALTGAGLPASADRHRAWWANDRSHSRAQAGLVAGWRVESVDQLAGRAVYVRAVVNGS